MSENEDELYMVEVLPCCMSLTLVILHTSKDSRDIVAYVFGIPAADEVLSTTLQWALCFLNRLWSVNLHSLLRMPKSISYHVKS